MAAYRRGEKNDVEETKASGRKSREKPALSPIEEEETDSPDSSGDSVINFRGIDHTDSSKKWRYDLRVSLSRDYEEVARDPEEELEEEKRITESPPFLTARNGSEDEAGSRSGDSSATASGQRSTPEDEPDDSSAPGESTSGEAVYYYNDEEEEDEEDRRNTRDRQDSSFTEMTKNIKIRTRPKSAPASIFEDFSATKRDDRISEISTIVDWLRIRIVKSEGEIYRLKKQLRVERLRSYKFAKRYDEDVNLTKESVRLDLEMWIKKLNDGLKSYLAEWQQRERLRINEEVSRISDLYSQEITKSLKASLRDWQIEESRKMLEAIEARDKSRQDRERSNTKAVYEKIQMHLENLDKRNRKSCASFRKQIDKWEDRLRDEVVRLHEENLKKLRQQVDKWCEDSHPKAAETPPQLENVDEKPSLSFPGADALIQVEENLLKRLRDSSSKDLRRTEQIVRTELKAQRRELAKRMNDKISELWMAFEEFGCVGFDRSRSRRSATSCLPAPPARNDLEVSALGKDSILNTDILGGRSVAGKIIRAIRTGGSTRSTTDVEDGDRDFCEDDDDDSLLEDVGERKIADQSSPSPS